VHIQYFTAEVIKTCTDGMEKSTVQCVSLFYQSQGLKKKKLVLKWEALKKS